MTRFSMVIADDEPPARDRISHFMEALQEWQVVGCFGDGPALLAFLEKNPVDLVLLDIGMPGLSGLEVWQALPEEQRPEVIFVTAHDQFAVQAFDVFAVDYLLKPFEKCRLEVALSRAVSRLEAKHRAGGTAQSEPGLGKDSILGRLVVREHGKISLITLSEIRWIEAAGNYLQIHHQTGTHLVRQTLKQVLEELPSAFFLQVHRSSVVNLFKIKTWNLEGRQDGTLVLDDQTLVKVGRHYRDAISKRLLQQTV